MRVFDADLSKALQSEEARGRIATFLSDGFDPVVLERATFLDEMGLRPEDGPLLRAGGLGFRWLKTRVFERALADEIRSLKLTPQRFLTDFPSETEEKQWKESQKVFLRMEQLVLSKEPSKILPELGMREPDLEALRKQWRAEAESQDQSWALAIQLQLLGVGRPRKELVTAVTAQMVRPFLFFFRLARPVLTTASDADTELMLQYQAGEETLLVRQSLAREIEENSKFGPEMWAKQWVDYFKNHPRIRNTEFRAFLHHLEDGERYKWPNLMAGAGTKARRGVAAAINALLEVLEDATDQAAIQRLLDKASQFSEKHEMEAILKKRFGV